MNRAQLRTMLRRRLQEVTETASGQWSNDTLNTYLVLGLQFFQKKIMVIDPMAFQYTDLLNVQQNVSDYPMPVNAMFETGVYLKSSSGVYGWLDFIERPHIQMSSGPNWNNPYSQGYARKGRYIVLHPIPSGAISQGLKVEYVPWLSMGSDTDSPDIDIGLHEGIVYRAEMIALGDTSQEAVRAKEDLEAVMGDLQTYYRRTGAQRLIVPILPNANDYQDASP